MQSNNQSTDSSSERLERFISWCALISALAAVVMLIFLVIFFAGVGIFGPLNDIGVTIQYIFMLPIAFYIHQRIKVKGRFLSIATTSIGVLGMLAVIVLQTLLVVGVIPFRQQIGMVVIAFLVVMVWFVLIENLGRDDDLIPNGRLLAVLAGLTIGYPVWAYRFRRNLGESEANLVLDEKPVI